MNISAKELANLVHVSPATVSMVFNNKPGISESTRELVLKTAREYGYKLKDPSTCEAESGVIQLICYKKHGKIAADTPFFSQMTEGITNECTRQNCALHVSYFYENMDTSKQLESLNSVDCIGILLLATEMKKEDFNKFKNFSVPIVVLDCYYDEINYDCVLINNIQGAFNATSHLIKCGHKNIGYLHSNIDISNFSERADGYYKALRACDISTSHPYVHLITPTSEEGYQDMINILNQKTDLADAYFADNDIIAAAAMKAFRENGIRIPEDISIIGFDDMPLCDMMVPSLSTMRVKKKELGATAVQRLMDRVSDNHRESLKMSMSTKLIKRDSVSKLTR
ncbi:LacI family DNA-binding transcriptional regulator [Blautia liquoris]|uniref:LacI family DNA-binding transcriptional regulator n=1 Tax=Blautia liquoris TaxID=2779518 RepID=A0A7M2RIV3_9FIRM|nr:LacI family DNA-binding transcriptional regulator [Blautia liquoris]QOV20263.1 LacI family DNA-binding transcriptional regulator [Blautia liquoris]